MGKPEPEAKVGAGDAKSCSVNQRSWPDYVVNFLNFVMKTFEHQPETYRDFFRLMTDYRNYRVCSDCLIARVYLLFKEHKELLKGFHEFVPPKQHKSCDGLDFEDVIAFVNKIKLRFSQEPTVFEFFLQILNNYKTGTYDCADTIMEISKLFEGHPDLLMEYWKYMPPIK